MKNLLTFATLLLASLVLTSNVSAQFPPFQMPTPTTEETEEMQEQTTRMLKPMIKKAFDNSDSDANDSLDEEEMLEFAMELFKARTNYIIESGIKVPEPSEAELSEIREEMKQRLDEQFKLTDTDESGDVTHEEILKHILGDAHAGKDEEGEHKNKSDEADTSASDISKESATDAQ